MNQQKSGLVPGILVGLLAMLVGAGLVGAFIGLTGRQIGIFGVGVGLLVGFGIMTVKPTSPVLPPLAAVMGLAGAALGQILGVSILVAKLGIDGMPVSFGDALPAVAGNFSDVTRDNPLMLAIWAISAAAAFSFVNKRVKEAAPAAHADAPAGPADAQGWTPTPPQANAPMPPQADVPAAPQANASPAPQADEQDPAPKA
ncbi:PrgI family protein [Nonomuraea sediminis]|uniref:PrgI family protein n=1 Tax=Nonomuraea sediminis TaxID=2835864 RepID=UPI001BDDA021|nr:PrgI family protein [Nonomuraea sediminis]